MAVLLQRGKLLSGSGDIAKRRRSTILDRNERRGGMRGELVVGDDLMDEGLPNLQRLWLGVFRMPAIQDHNSRLEERSLVLAKPNVFSRNTEHAVGSGHCDRGDLAPCVPKERRGEVPYELKSD